MTFEIWKFENYISNSKKFQVPQFLIMIFFPYVNGRLSSFYFFFPSIFYIKRVLNLEFYKTDFLLLEFKSPY